MKQYDHTKIEKKWQKKWESTKVNRAKDHSKQKKFYSLIEFPYPSGDGLHVGHIRSNTAMDVISRKRRMEGYNVLYPIGWDAFGLPAENYAIKTGIHPSVVVKKNTDIFRKQLKSLGFSFDWSREINTTDPKYYKWTQWIFLQFLKKGLAYKKKLAVNWCPKDFTVLANEEVIDGSCERCGTKVEKREKEQWMLAITKYAERLDKDLDETDFLEKIKIQQRNWIGKSEGAEIEFPVVMKKNKVRFVLLHGYEGSPKANFFPWLKNELEKRGYEVEVPELPNSKYPKESEQVDFVIKNCRFDENTIVMGHSLGAVVAMKVLMRLNKPVSGLVLIAGAVDPKFHDDSRPFEKDFNWDFDYSLIQNLTDGKISILSDIKEKYRMPYLKYLAEKLQARLVETESNDEHFCAEVEPEILKSVTPLLSVFTTRPDTLFGVTYLVLSPENECVNIFLPYIENKNEVLNYIKKSKSQTNINHTDAKLEKTGIELKGLKAINPVNGEEIPVWIADYVLADYGTGAVMAVPAHDERDWEFAKRYGLEIRDVVMPVRIDLTNPHRAGKKVVERKAIQAIVRNPKTDKILCLKWKKQPWTTFIVGGMEDGEDIVESAKREVMEETGYKNLKFIRVLGGPVKSEFFATHKDENRVAYFSVVYFELDNDEKVSVNPEELEKHEPIWLDLKDIRRDTMQCGELDIWLYRLKNENNASIEEGILVNSAQFDGKDSTLIKKEITEFAGGKWVTRFKLRDWIFSRQRYWGEPIPVVHCEKCGIVPVPEKDLPVKLPKVKNYKPTETGESPLASISKWLNTKCPKCKGKAKRETDTMPNWAGSSWYYLRYTDTKNKKTFADKKKLQYWTAVDWYNGGMEHTTLHLLYSRFWHKFLFDQGLVPTSEPYKKRTSHGLILAEGGEKMSKSKGDTINPDEIVKTIGADALRMHEMFMGPFDQAIVWDTNTIAGSRRFIERVWRLQEKIGGSENKGIEVSVHKTIKKVSEDIENMKFNTAISSMMIFLNELEREGPFSKKYYEVLLRLLAPFIPHITEEIWEMLGNKESINYSSWPEYDADKVMENTVQITIQINGKVRGSMECKIDKDDLYIKDMALNKDEIKKWISGMDIKRIIIVKNKLINIVI